MKTKQDKSESSTQPVENVIEFSPRILEILETLDEVFVKNEAVKPTPEKELVYC